MLWDQLRPGQKFDLETDQLHGLSKSHHPRLCCHLLKPVHDARQVMTTLPVRDGFRSHPAHLAFPAGTRLQVRFMDPALGCWRFHAGIIAYDQYEGREALVLSAWSPLSPCERRAYARRICSIPVLLGSADKTGPIHATMLNYSAGGVLIVTDCPLTPGRRFVLAMPTSLGCTISVSCRVMRLEQTMIGYGQKFHVALAFDEPRTGLPLL